MKNNTSELARYWINQPSKLQYYHKLHGTNVLGYLEYEGTFRIYYLSGDIISSQIPSICLSEGWNKDSFYKQNELSRKMDRIAGFH